MKKEAISFLEKLTRTPSPSGFEQPVQKIIRESLQGHVESLESDIHGNLIACKNSKGKPRVMISGHCDEIGFMITHISNEGFIHFAPIGGIDAGLLSGLRVKIHTEKGPVLGVVGKKPIHHMTADDLKKKPDWKSFWIDIGAKDGKQAKKVVETGDPITYEENFDMLLDNNVVSRGFDDKIGAFIVTETIRSVNEKKMNCSLYSVSTVQEEIGLRGARTSAFGIDPDIGIAVDIGFSSDHPEADKRAIGDIKLGKGPILYKGANINPVIGRMLIDIARKMKIPFQLAASPRATGTDANAMQINRKGVATALISIPTRYGHTPVEVLSMADTENAIKLLIGFVESLPKSINLIP
ncbi:MAG: M42 family metallopeptidase [Candidatus Theseobacter exili]|nr:M42 family metallopeptidase [Candidatus Theseobacter exili]